MASSVTKGLAVGAVLFGGVLAGVTANRALVQLPAVSVRCADSHTRPPTAVSSAPIWRLAFALLKA
jgi:hypothetical protein